MGTTLFAFLAEKERRSGSQRTVQSYSRMLRDFFGRTGKTPDKVTSQDVFTWAYGTGPSGKEPSSVTIGARLACISSFYRFLIRMKVVPSNPCDLLDEPSRSVAMLSGVGETLPNPRLLINPFLRREAVLSSRIEGTLASISDVLRYEAFEGRSAARSEALQSVSSRGRQHDHPPETDRCR